MNSSEKGVNEKGFNEILQLTLAKNNIVAVFYL